jgi:hypothetical protein
MGRVRLRSLMVEKWGERISSTFIAGINLAVWDVSVSLAFDLKQQQLLSISSASTFRGFSLL